MSPIPQTSLLVGTFYAIAYSKSALNSTLYWDKILTDQLIVLIQCNHANTIINDLFYLFDYVGMAVLVTSCSNCSGFIWKIIEIW